MGPKADRIDLVLSLVLDPGVDGVLGEDIALQEELMVGLKGIKDLIKTARQGLDSLGLFRLQLIEILVDRLARVDLLLDAVDPPHQHGAERQIGVAAWIRSPELDPLRRLALGINGDPGARRAVSLAIDEIDRRLVAGDQP